MNFENGRRDLLATACATILGALAPQVRAHDFQVGELVVDHPYAPPTVPGASTGAVYFRTIRNRGRAPDRLVAASTPAATRVELHEMRLDGGVMRMREVDAIPIPAGQDIEMRHGQRHHLMLVGLRRPLATGDRLDLTLRFESAGEIQVKVWVQQPRQAAAAHAHDRPAGAAH